jgi:hypothetical protein
MAHEYSHYEGAIGPEGLRRTTTYFGPVIGGLPIDAWHCETCGLLRLSYPDGRTEERRLYPGPQPDLLAVPTAFDPQQVGFGSQARVSGLTVQPRVYAQLAAPYAGAPFTPPWQRVTLPSWNFLTWLTVVGLTVVMAGLLTTGVLAVYDYQTPESIGPAINITGWTFFAVLVAQLLGAAQRHWFPFPPIAEPVATTQRGEPAMDGATVAVVTLLTLTMVGLFAAGILAVYTYSTSAAEEPVVVLTAICGVGAVLILIVGAVARHVRKPS